VSKSQGTIFLVRKAEKANSLKGLGEPGRTRTSNPLLNPETLSSWLFLHFHASSITVFEGVWQGFVPKVVPRFVADRLRIRVQRTG